MRTFGHIALALVLGSAPAFAADEAGFDRLARLSLEDLLKVQVSSPTRYEQSILDSPNSIWIISREDIRRSGLRHIPEVLTLAPGMLAQQFSGNRWKVTLDGFGLGEFTNNILVLIDNVVVYSSLFGQVEWGLLPLSIEEIERIEIIRGPGGVLYGANAVNGVISFRTQRRDVGAFSAFTLRTGTQGERIGGARMGDRVGSVDFQLGVEHDQDEGLGRRQGRNRPDNQQFFSASGHAATELSQHLKLTVGGRSKLGDYTFAEQTNTIPSSPRELQTYLAHARLERSGDPSDWGFHLQADRRRQLVYNHTSGTRQQREDSQADEVNGQLNLPVELAGRHRWALGGGFRSVDIEHALLKHGEQRYHVSNGYVHDEYAPVESLRLYGGIKIEKFSLMPATLQWRIAAIIRPGEDQAIRLSAANAVRSPSLYEFFQETVSPLSEDVTAQVAEWPEGARQENFRIEGDPDLDPERYRSYEIEYRLYLAGRFLLDVDYAYREAKDLLTSYKTDTGYFVEPIGGGDLLGPFGVYYLWQNAGSIKSHSVNTGLEFRPSDRFRWLISAAWVEMHNTEGFDKIGGRERNQPRVFGRSQMDWLPGWGLEAGAGLRYTSDNPSTPDSDAYWRLDARLAWRTETDHGDLLFQLAGHNLADEWHGETRQPIRRLYLATLALEM